MAYTAVNKPTDNFNTVLYTGNGSSNHTITGVGFNADWVWVKNRGGDDHRLFDQVRGINKFVKSNSTAAETTDAILTTNSDGYVLTNAGEVNANSGNFVGWNWKAGGTGSSNSDGTITSTVSANTTAGFSIVKFTGNGNGSATFGHGLGVKPKIGLLKPTSTTGNWNWWQDTTGNNSADVRVHLHLTDANNSNYPITFNTNTITLPSVADSSWNGNGTEFIFYCFAEKKGYSKFGSYIGNGYANGTFVYTGFKPAWVINKRIDSTGNWMLIDNKRLGYNPAQRDLRPNLTNAEGNDETFDFFSNGFKVRTTSNDFGGGSGATYIYMAFAEEPLVGTNNIPATAR